MEIYDFKRINIDALNLIDSKVRNIMTAVRMTIMCFYLIFRNPHARIRCHGQSEATSGVRGIYSLNTNPPPTRNGRAPACAEALASCTAPSSASGASSCSLVSNHLNS